MRRLKNKKTTHNNNNISDDSTSATTLSNLDATNTDLHKAINSLRSANDELTKDNASKKMQIGSLSSDRLLLMNQVNQLTTELQSYKNQRQDIRGMVNEFLQKWGQLSEDLFRIVERVQAADNSIIDTTVVKRKASHAFHLTPSQQQTHAVKPMISGHTIQNPVINLPRVSPAQLERMVNRAVENVLSNDTSTNEDQHEQEASQVGTDELGENDVSEGSSTLQTDGRQGSGNAQALFTISEETDLSSSPSTLINSSRAQQDDHLRDASSVLGASTSVINPLEENTVHREFNQTERVNMRRRQRQSLIIATESATSLISSESLVPANFVPLQPMEEIPGGIQESVMSNTIFVNGLDAADAASTPMSTITDEERRRTRIVDNDIPSLVTRRRKMPQCSVIITRMSTAIKRKSISPKHTRSNEISSEQFESTDSSTISTNSPKRRPIRAAKPRSLKEHSLKGKLRRRN